MKVSPISKVGKWWIQIESILKTPSILVTQTIISRLSHLVVLIIFFTITVTAQSRNELPTDSLINLAQQYLDSLQYQKAIELAETILTNATEQPTQNRSLAYSIQGDAYREQGQYDQAIERYSLSKENGLRFPQQPSLMVAQANNDLGLCYWRKRDLNLAEKYFKETLNIRLQLLGEMHPKVADTYNNLGNIAFDKRDLNTARSFYEKILSDSGKNLENRSYRYCFQL